VDYILIDKITVNCEKVSIVIYDFIRERIELGAFYRALIGISRGIMIFL